MTILPTKKASQQKSDSDGNDHSERHSQVPAENIEIFNFNNRNSPPRWVSGTSREEKRAAHVSGITYDSGDAGPSLAKRRHRDRSSPHRHIRKSLRSCSNNGTFAAPGTSQCNLTSVPDRTKVFNSVDEDPSGYNSGDEYDRPNELWSEQDVEREALFERLLNQKGLIIKKMEEDGACLFRAVADQVYGDQEMHLATRKLCMDYMEKNADYYSQYVTEEFDKYIARKRNANSHGNHVEIQALSEMYNRPIEVYHYSLEPINTFHGSQRSDNHPIRLSYHRNVHYNSIIDPFKPTAGVGLGLPQLKAGCADKKIICDALLASESVILEQQMLEDKLRATDYEATSEALEEQVARESYLEWLRENERRARGGGASTSASSASATATSSASATASSGCHSPKNNNSTPSRSSPLRSSSRAVSSPNVRRSMDSKSPKACSSPKAGTSWSSEGSESGSAFQVCENASFLNCVPVEMFGIEDYSDKDEQSILAQVMAESQLEYLDLLRRQKSTNGDS